MAGINVSSLTSSLTGSSFDWQAFVEQIITIDSAPITRLQTEQSTNGDKLTSLNALGTDITDLQTATTALSAPGLFTGRAASSSTTGSNWGVTASSGAALGNYTFNVTQLATSTTRSGSTDIGSGISATNDVTGVTLASMATASPITAGNFTVNGAQVNVALTDSLQDVFDKISTATGGAVTGSYDSTTDKISLNSSSEVLLGAANDSSNFLAVSRLSNNGTGAISSGTSLGTVKTNVPLASSHLKSAITAVDSGGAGSFMVNGVAIIYNVNTDSLSDVLGKITNSTAGVAATYDSTNDRIVMTNKTTGDVGVGMSEVAGGFLDAIGVSNGSAGLATARGLNAKFTVNGGPVLSSNSNTLDSTVTGITGLSVTAKSKEAQTVSVTSNTDAMKTAVQGFIDKYNVLQSFLSNQTDISVNSGTVKTATLSDNRTVQDWGRSIRQRAFNAIGSVSGTVKQLADLGIDFQGTGNQLLIRDSSKLDAALSNHPDDVQAFFNTATTGFSATMNKYLGTLMGSDGTGTDGALSMMKNTLTGSNASIDQQIAAIQRQLDSEKARLTTGFQAMQAAQQNAKTMSDALTNAFSTSNK